MPPYMLLKYLNASIQVVTILCSNSYPLWSYLCSPFPEMPQPSRLIQQVFLQQYMQLQFWFACTHSSQIAKYCKYQLPPTYKTSFKHSMKGKMKEEKDILPSIVKSHPASVTYRKYSQRVTKSISPADTHHSKRSGRKWWQTRQMDSWVTWIAEAFQQSLLSCVQGA